MSPEDTKYLRACKLNGLIIDTNLLLIFLIGSYNPRLTDEKTFIYIKRVLAFTEAKIIITPHILTEISNMTITKQIIKEPGHIKYVESLIDIIEQAHEEPIEKNTLMGSAGMLADFGFTDLSIIEAAMRLQCAVMTADGALATQLLNNKCFTRNVEYLIPVPTL
jgi:hypothetical protein